MKNLTVVELKQLCRDKGITGYSKLNKADLIKKCKAAKAKRTTKRASKKPSKRTSKRASKKPSKRTSKRASKKPSKRTTKKPSKRTTKKPRRISKGCTEQTTSKYLNRNSPPYPAQGCPNSVKQGNDGKNYFSKPDKNGVYKWVLI